MYLGRLVTEEFLFFQSVSVVLTQWQSTAFLSLSLSLSDCFYAIHFQHDVSGLVGRPFVKRWFALCYRTVILSVLSVCNVAKRLDGHQDETCPSHIVLDGDPALHLKRGTAPNFWLMSVVAKRLDGSKSHLVRW